MISLIDGKGGVKEWNRDRIGGGGANGGISEREVGKGEKEKEQDEQEMG